MLDLFAITAPIFLLIGVGFAAVLSGIVTKSQTQGLAAFVLNFALPALIIDALSNRPFGQIFDPGYLLAYGAGSVIVFASILVVMLFVLRRRLSHAAIAAMGSAGSNSGFIGYPVAFLAVGDIATTGLALNMMIENLLIIPLGLALAESGASSGERLGAILARTFGRLARNPIVIAIIVGTALSLAGLRLPGPVDTALSMMATASAPAALFVIGGALVGLRLGGVAGDVAIIVGAKLVLHPLAVLCGFMVFPTADPAMVVLGVLFASVPMMSVYPLFGQRFGMEEICAASLMAATIAAFVSVTAVRALTSGW
jgi:malonate transporter and related proteins